MCASRPCLLQMPDYSYFGSALAAAVAAGNVSEARIDDMVTRMLVPYFALVSGRHARARAPRMA